MAAPVVTALMPVYNGAAYLAEALDSILRQTLAELELLVVDDGSTDDTPHILQACSDPRVAVIRNEKNLGVVATLNRGLEAARGEFVARMDADDVALPNRFQKQVDFLRGSPRTGLCGTWFRTIGAGRATTVRPPTAAEDVAARLFYESPLAHSTVMFRRALFTKHSLHYAPDFPHAEDFELWTRVARVAEMVNLPEVLLHYRRHEEQVSSVRKAKQEESVGGILLRQLRRIHPDATDAERRAHIAICANRAASLYGTPTDFVESWLAGLIRRNEQAGEGFPPAAFRRAIAIVWWRYCSSRVSTPGILKTFYASSLARELPLKNTLGMLAVKARTLVGPP